MASTGMVFGQILNHGSFGGGMIKSDSKNIKGDVVVTKTVAEFRTGLA